MDAHPTIYFTKGRFYIFTEVGVHHFKLEHDFGTGWKNTTCLVDADLKNAPAYVFDGGIPPVCVSGIIT